MSHWIIRGAFDGRQLPAWANLASSFILSASYAWWNLHWSAPMWTATHIFYGVWIFGHLCEGCRKPGWGVPPSGWGK